MMDVKFHSEGTRARFPPLGESPKEMPVIHEIVELIKALAWPSVALYFILKFQRQIGALLNEMPNIIRRVRSAHGLGVEIELEKIGGELPIAELQAQSLALKMPEVPVANETRGHD